MLANAAAAARSDFPDAVRWATRGRLLVAFKGAPLTLRFTPAAPCAPGTVESRLGAAGFTGELPETSRLPATAGPLLKLVTGGSGRGRARCEGVWEEATRLTGDETPEVPFACGLGRAARLTPVINS